MADDENPIQSIKTRAMELFPDDPEERDDYVTGRMARIGYKKGPGEWIREEDDDTPQEDDDEPVTRADIRRMNRERSKKSTENDGGTTAPPKVNKEKKPLKEQKGNAWW
jgi:hypothetical protein